ncbi:MAG: nitroreductase family protein [Bdellovibrionales bacterium]|nr:nitroreductase family protein [Bdellovibrionales bacterium]
MSMLPNPLEVRSRDHDILDLFLQRWSPRALSGEAVNEEDLLRLFEAARWAPSTYNEQEWRFLYAKKGTPHWDTFFGVLLEANQVWCKDAAYLIAVVARETFVRNGNPNPVAILDTGAAMQNLLLQAAHLNLVAHPMAGFDWEGGPKTFNIPDGFRLTAMIAVGKPGNPETLPAELAEREQPTERKPLEKIAREGTFSFEE